MNKKELLKALRLLQENGDYEIAHSSADKLLIEFINDDEITVAFEKIGKWYA